MALRSYRPLNCQSWRLSAMAHFLDEMTGRRGLSYPLPAAVVRICPDRRHPGACAGVRLRTGRERQERLPERRSPGF